MERPRDDEFDSLRDLMRGDAADDSFDAADDPADQDESGDLPPGVPPEYADAYRRGFESGRGGEEPRTGDEPTVQIDPRQAAGPRPSAAPVPADTTQAFDPFADEAPTAESPRVDAPLMPPARSEVAHPEPTQQIAFAPPPPAPPSYDEEADPDEESRKPPLRAILLGVLALVVVLGAFGIGRLVADNASGKDSAAGDGSGKEAAYAGPVEAVTVSNAGASCQTANSVDAAGNVVSYEPAKAYDSNLATAWRCDGPASGQRVTVTLPQDMEVAEVGMVPGYAKTDPASGVDRYAENNRITKVRWRFDDGSTYVQRMKGDPADRSMRTMRIPATSTKRVVIEILASQPGPRNTIAISELRIATPSG